MEEKKPKENKLLSFLYEECNKESTFLRIKLEDLKNILKKLILNMIKHIECNSKGIIDKLKYIHNLDSIYIFCKYNGFELLNIMECTVSALTSYSQLPYSSYYSSNSISIPCSNFPTNLEVKSLNNSSPNLPLFQSNKSECDDGK